MGGPFNFFRMAGVIQTTALACCVCYAAGNGFAMAQQSSVAAPESSEVLPYATVKQPRRLIITSRDEISSNEFDRHFLEFYPQHGVVVSSGSLFSDKAHWVSVDFDARTIVRLEITDRKGADGKREIGIDSKVGRSLSVAEVNEIIRQANVIWNPGPPRSSSVPDLPMMDGFLDATLFDGPYVTTDYASSEGPDPLIDAIQKLSVR